jgi:YbbR domain-containing protein
MRRWFFDNFALKLLAVFIAFALWAYVGSRQILERKVTLHLELSDIPAGMTLDSSVKTSIPVVLTGRKENVLDLDPEDLKAVVSLKAYSASQKEMVVHPRVQPLPDGVTASLSDLAVRLVELNDPKVPPKRKRK